MSLSDIVNVSITAQTTAPTRVGFGTPLVMSFHTVFPERARVYTSTTAMIADGFPANHEAVRAVSALFAQNPRCSSVVVGRETNRQKMKLRLTPPSTNLKAAYAYKVTINGLDATYTSDSTPTQAEIVAGLKAAIDALAQPVVTTTGATYLDVEASTIAAPFTLYAADRNVLKIENTTPDGTPNGIVADIAAVQVENDSWYGLILCNHGHAVIMAAAAYIETLVKVMAVSVAADACYDGTSTTDTAAALATAGYARTFSLYHPKDLVQYPEAAWLGLGLPQDPGSITWKFKTMAGVDSIFLTETEIGVLRAKFCNFYHTVAGIAITEEGVTAAGEFIDITQGIDFIRARLQEYVYARLANSKKIPFTDKGIAIIEAEVRAVMSLAINQEILAAVPAPVVTVPLAADVPFVDKAARLLDGVTFEATLAGAIHKVVITGSVSV